MLNTRMLFKGIRAFSFIISIFIPYISATSKRAYITPRTINQISFRQKGFRMCTVTYIGQENGNFLLTSNRDVPAKRSSPIVESVKIGTADLIFPKDALAGGTWIAMSSDGQVVCLLNGAFERHQVKASYRKSRGTMVLEFFEYKSAEDFFEKYNYRGIEPFTFIIYEKGTLWEFRWDETQKHIKILDSAKKYIWSSAPLYDKQAQQKRAYWFATWLENQQVVTPDSVIDFHLNGGEKDDWNGFIMNRFNIVQTVSNTSIHKNDGSINLRFHDFISNTKTTNSINLA